MQLWTLNIKEFEKILGPGKSNPSESFRSEY